MKLTPLDIQRHSFQTRFRRVDADEVRTFLNMIAEEMEQAPRGERKDVGRS